MWSKGLISGGEGKRGITSSDREAVELRGASPEKGEARDL